MTTQHTTADAYRGTLHSARSVLSPNPWGGVLAMSLCVAVLIASEFMPVSLLSPIAHTLTLTDGQAGAAISVSGFCAVVTSLCIADLTWRLDRKLVLLAQALILMMSGVIVTFAPNYAVLMFGRALLGVAIGGFWSMSTAVLMRLLPPDDVPRGLSLLNAGNAIAATISAPLGSLLGGVIGWRGAFFSVVPLALAALVWMWLRLPALPPRESGQSTSTLRCLSRVQVVVGMLAIGLFFMGQFALFTYLRPYIERVVGLSVTTLSATFLLMGIAGVAGTWVISSLLPRRLFGVATTISLVMAVLAGLLTIGYAIPPVVVGLLVAWGFFSTAAPVAWANWLSRTFPDDAEAGGGLYVAVIQFAIMIGATAGGFLYDQASWTATFCLAGVLLVGSAFMTIVAAQNRSRGR